MFRISSYNAPLFRHALLVLLALVLVMAPPGAWAKKPEGGGGGKPDKTAILTVTASGPGQVSFLDADGTTVSCRDTTCTATYPAGNTTVTLNAAPDPDATFAGWSGDCSGNGACEVTMRKDRSVGSAFAETPPPPQSTVSIADAGTVEEGTSLAYVVSLDGSGDQVVTADLAFGNGSATGGEDYEASFYAEAGLITGITSVAFDPGETSQTVYVRTFNDDPPYGEADETVIVLLGNISGAQAGDTSATGTLTDSDPPPPPPATPRASAAGDSITMAFAASCAGNKRFWDLFCLVGGDQPENSWFDGSSSSVLSVIDRYRLEVDPDTSGTKAAAESGSEMVGVTVGGETPRNFVDQAAEIVGQVPLPNRVEVMLGGNDICNRDCADPADCGNPLLDDDSWRAGVGAGLDILVDGLPQGATILLVGVPRVQDLYAAGIAREQADSGVNCQSVWSTYGICRIATNDGTLNGESHAERLAAIGERQQRYNEILAELAQTYSGTNGIEVVAEYGDGQGLSVGTYAFGAGDINGGDCFHPSVSGQNIVADVVWGNNPDNPAP